MRKIKKKDREEDEESGRAEWETETTLYVPAAHPARRKINMTVQVRTIVRARGSLETSAMW
jgi:hypothetical protein